jgi:inhibitor of cysteine peptidase
VQRLDDPTQAGGVAVGEVFAIALAGNPTTGYTWQACADTQYVALVAQTFELQGPGVGAGGHEVFHFRAVRTGKTEITFEYRRPWGGEVRQTKCFQVVIG